MNNNIHDENLVNLITGHLCDKPEIEKMRKMAVERNIPVIQRESADIIRLLIRIAHIESILEIGTAIGYSASLFYGEMENGRITTIEKRPDSAIEAAENFKRLGYRNIRILEGDAIDVISGIDEKFDMIFIDAGKSHYREYFDKAFPLLNNGGIIVSDNILMNGLTLNYDMNVRKNRTMVRAMRGYIKFLCSHPSLKTTLMPVGDGLAVSHYQKETRNE
ncbi:MAG: O-methyltransferase [Clostridiales bacterium]|nr:MAG: O-methyltransferase [Clostridiales bacterium]